MNKRYADLHTHTNASDGTRPPRENVRLAKEAGLAAVAITDHDTLAGLEEAVLEGKRLGVEVVPGVEISTFAYGQDIHVLGYGIDGKNAEFANRLADLRQARKKRNEMLIERLGELGFLLTLEEVAHNAGKRDENDETIGRPHIADLMVKKGCVSSVSEAFSRYLGKGGQAYVSPQRIGPQEAIAWIHEAGGTAVLAHPGLYGNDALIDELAANGLDGIEAFHSDHSPEEEQKYAALATQYGLIVTAGSDFHGERRGELFHAPIGARKTDIAVIAQLLKKRT